MSGLSVEEARGKLWEALSPGPVVELPLNEAMGKVLAEDLHTDLAFPPFDRMAMDGYAVRAGDTSFATGDHPVRLKVIGAAFAGAVFDRALREGEAVRAMTGAPLPPGADAVVPVESTDGYDSTEAVIRQAAAPGDHIATAGEDLQRGDLVLEAGTHLSSRHVQALAASGHAMVPVVAPPVAAVLSTGDELVGIEAIPGPGQIRGSNGPSVMASLAEWGIECTDLGAVGDDEAELRSVLASALSRYELLVLSGGVSMGEKDRVKPVLRELGVELHFTSLHVKPGHPATFGTHEGGAVFALPGNPVSAYVGLRTIYSAGLRRRLGYRQPTPPRTWGVLDFNFDCNSNRPMYIPVSLHASKEASLPLLRSTSYHGSGDFSSLAKADALAWIDEKRRWPRGTTVEILRLDPLHSA